MRAHFNLMFVLCHTQTRVCGVSLDGCTSPTTSMYLVWHFMWNVAIRRHQERYKRTQESYNTSNGWWVSTQEKGRRTQRLHNAHYGWWIRWPKTYLTSTKLHFLWCIVWLIYYLELRNAIIVYYAPNFLPTMLELVVWTLWNINIFTWWEKVHQ